MNLRIILCIAVLAMASLVQAETDVRELGWDDLIPAKLNFDDPFEKLSQEQLYRLATVARFREKQGSVSSQGEGVNTEYKEALASLNADNVDIDGLLARRAEITEKRRLSASTPNHELDGKNVRIPGYLLPLEFRDKQVVEFLLVPWVGACIHTPPPPPNQIVHVKLDQGFDVGETVYAPVWVNGRIAIENNRPELNYIDGKQNIDVNYLIVSASVAPYDE